MVENNKNQFVNFVRDHRAAFVIGESLWLIHFFAGKSVDPNLGWTNILPFVPLVRAAGQDLAYALGTTAAELSKAALLVPFFNTVKGGVIKAMEYKDKVKEHNQRLQEGREPLLHPAILAIDLTNLPGTGNHEGELIDGLKRHRKKNMATWQLIENVFGPVCEVVRENTPQPVNIPEFQYLRMKTNGFRDKETLKKRGAEYAAGILLCMLDKDHTVFDSNPEAAQVIDDMIERIIGACDNVEEIKSEEKNQQVQLPKIVIVNDREHSRHEAISMESTATQQGKLEDFFPEYQGYSPIIAEKAVVEDLLVRMQGKRIAFFTPKGGSSIGKNFLSYMNRYVHEHQIQNPPIILRIEDGKLGESLAKNKPDLIFVIGENDASVTGATESIIQFQATNIKTNENYPICPVLTFLEGHSSDSTIKRIQNFISSDNVKKDNLKQEVVYLHDILSSKVAKILQDWANMYNKSK